MTGEELPRRRKEPRLFLRGRAKSVSSAAACEKTVKSWLREGSMFRVEDPGLERAEDLADQPEEPEGRQEQVIKYRWA